jgi:hypothetical protein
MLEHAKGLGKISRFGPKEVEQSYKELAGRISDSKVIEGITDIAAQLAMALGSDLPTAVKTLENVLFATGAKIDDANEGLATARKYSAQLMKMAKLGGFTSLEEVAEAVKFPTAIASVAGVSLPTEAAVMALMKRGGQSGPEAGVAMRAVVSALVRPTQLALTALDAAGIQFSKYVTAGKHMTAADLSSAFERRLGKKFPAGGLADVQTVLNTPELVADQAKFTSAVVGLLGKDLKPQNQRQIAKVVESFWQASISKVDVDRLVRDVIAANLSPSQINAIFGPKQGGRFAVAARYGLAEFEKERKKIAEVPETYPEQIAKERMAGVAGSMARLNTAIETLGVAFVQANEKWLIPATDEATKLINRFSELDGKTLEIISAIGGVVAALTALKTATWGVAAVRGLAGGAAGAVAGAGAAGAVAGRGLISRAGAGLAGLLSPALIGGSAPLAAGMVLFGATPAEAPEDFAR